MVSVAVLRLIGRRFFKPMVSVKESALLVALTYRAEASPVRAAAARRH